MPFLIAQPDMLDAAAGELHGINAALLEGNSAAAIPTTGVVPAAADAVSILTADPKPTCSPYGVTRILQCRSGSARSSKAAPTPSRPTSPVIIGAASMSPSASERSDSANSSKV
ncbi:Mycobacterium rhizamassiliense ORFan [Mycobacterium rhizamassiliense]|uniref:Mycobacterium rhizamassiliense ORFan n=1 Tax=Mycobacterium rhizamassiliense TaxID=1841860 RepID=A0A2U3NRS6_9MYCO|nr:Mycobacterium rhizamassiliense ORFan [Mycobacterium rhizamassiliense]